MKKLSSAMGLALALSVAAFASSGAQAQQQKGQRGQQAQQGEARRGPGGRGGAGFLLKGITLSESQKTQVKALHDAQRKEFEAKRGTGDKNKEQRVGRAQRDTAGMAARRAEMGKRREAEVASLRNILTNDQRVQFDKNVAEMKQRMAERQKQGGGRGENFRRGADR